MHISTANDPPRNFRYASICPRLDHLVSGRGPMTPREPTPPLAEAAGLLLSLRLPHCWVSLAIGPHSLARSSKRTTGHWQPSSYSTLTSVSFGWKILSCPRRSIAVRFQALLTSLLRVLFSFRSLYYCAIGLEICLVLEVGVPQLPAKYPIHGTQGQATSLLLRQRDYHPLRSAVPGKLVS